jgi:hypothetical protein
MTRVRRGPRAAAPLLVFLAILTAVFVVFRLSGEDTDVLVFLTRASAFASGLLPYRDFYFEYPPLAWIPLMIPRLCAAADYAAYRGFFALQNAAWLAATLWLLRRASRRAGDDERTAAARLWC